MEQEEQIICPPETRNLAEEVLSNNFGGKVVLAEGTGIRVVRSGVYRFAVSEAPAGAPATVVVKHIVPEEGKVFDPTATDEGTRFFFNEWASLQFLTETVPDRATAPYFYGGNREKGLLVMEDMGTGTLLSEILLGNDPQAAAQGLIDLMTVTGRLNAATIGKQAQYNAIRDALGPRPSYKPFYDYERIVATIKFLSEKIGVEPHPDFEADAATLSDLLTNSTAFLALGHADPCPDNCMYVDGQLRLFDYEFAYFRHALLDAAYIRVPFPSCWCMNRIPDEIRDKAEAAYRAELSKACPEAADDTTFYRGVVAATTANIIAYQSGVIKEFLETDHDWGIATGRQRFLFRYEMIANLTAQYGYLEALGATFGAYLAKLEELWAGQVEPLPYYPAFR